MWIQRGNLTKHLPSSMISVGYFCPISLGWRYPRRLQETQSGVVTEDIMLNSTELRQNEGGQEPFLALVASS